MAGNGNATWRSLRGGAIRSRHSRIAAMSPPFASSIAFRISSSASPSSNASSASVARLRRPLGLPAGFPLCPGLNLVSCFLPAISDFFLKTVSDHSKASVLAPTVNLTLIAFCGGPIGSLSAFLVGVIALAGLTLSRAKCLKNYTASAQCLICANGKCPPLLRRLLSARHPRRGIALAKAAPLPQTLRRQP